MTKIEKTKALRDAIRINYVPVSQLLLDDQNPRFAGLVKGLSEEKVLEKLREEMHLDELIESIKVNGYYNVEPLLTIEAVGKNGKFIVIEGNRRLAAIKILLSEDFKISETLREQITSQIPIAVYPGRKALWTYLGFRHINGPKEWDSYSKAVYALQVHNDYDIPIEKIADKIGDKNQTVVKMCNGLKLIEQAEKLGLIELKDVDLRRFYFSHLYTIIEKSNTKKFLGIDKKKGLLPKNPVPSNKINNLKLLTELIFGNEKKGIVSVIKSQNPDLKKLDTILGDRKSLDYLKENKNQSDALDNSLSFINEESFVLHDLAYKSLNALRKLLGILYKYDQPDKDFSKIIEEIKKAVEEIVNKVESNE